MTAIGLNIAKDLKVNVEQRRQALELTEEETYNILVNRLRIIVKQRPITPHDVQSSPPPAFDVDIYEVVSGHLRRFSADSRENVAQLAPLFYSAAWELSLRGVLRPSLKTHPIPGTSHIAGNGYSITERGRRWLSEEDHPIFFAIGELAHQLAKHKGRFGDAYHERAQEAIKCYLAGTYFACCAMTGASAEAILLRLAIEKLGGNEKKAHQVYNGSHGRKALKDKILELSQKPDNLKNEVEPGFTILTYWRDDAAHGAALTIDSTQASLALQMLCLFALAAEKRWTELTTPVIAG